MQPNTKLSTSSHAQRSASDSLIPAPTHQHRYCSAMGTTPPRARLRLRTAVPLRDGGTREPDLSAQALSGYGNTMGTEQPAARAPAHFTSLGLSGMVLRTPLPLLPSRLP